MSYLAGGALQAAIFARLSGDAGVAAAVGGAVYDEVPAGMAGGTYVVLGEETVRDRSDADGAGAEHRITVSVTSDAAGFAAAKAAAAAVVAALTDAPLDLSPARAVGLWFDRAEAFRLEEGAGRRIDLRFRLRVEF